MSLIGHGNRTLRPQVDHSKCVENVRGGACGRCSQVCETGVDPRHPELGENWTECTKCRACVENCPGHAISMPFFPKAKKNAEAEADSGNSAA